MTLPKEIYVWDESTPGRSGVASPLDLNLERDGKRPTPEPEAKEPIRAGVYRLVHEVEIFTEVREVTVKQAVEPLDDWRGSWKQ